MSQVEEEQPQLTQTSFNDLLANNQESTTGTVVQYGLSATVVDEKRANEGDDNVDDQPVTKRQKRLHTICLTLAVNLELPSDEAIDALGENKVVFKVPHISRCFMISERVEDKDSSLSPPPPTTSVVDDTQKSTETLSRTEDELNAATAHITEGQCCEPVPEPECEDDMPDLVPVLSTSDNLVDSSTQSENQETIGQEESQSILNGDESQCSLGVLDSRLPATLVANENDDPMFVVPSPVYRSGSDHF